MLISPFYNVGELELEKYAPGTRMLGSGKVWEQLRSSHGGPTVSCSLTVSLSTQKSLTSYLSLTEEVFMMQVLIWLASVEIQTMAMCRPNIGQKIAAQSQYLFIHLHMARY